MRLIFLLTLILCSCIQTPNSFSKLPPGIWRGVLKLADDSAPAEVSLLEGDPKLTDYFELPFNMEVSYEGEEMHVHLINGEEKILIENVHLGRDPRTAKDTLRLELTAFDTYMDGFYEENTIEGNWIVNYKEDYRIPYIITFGENHRFIKNPEPDTKDFSGSWEVVFDYDDDPYPAIAELKQNGNKLEGTFLTETGDYRFLSGNAYGDKMRLSVFDGAHAFLFRGSMDKDTIYGDFKSGKHYSSNWYAVRNESFELKDPDAMTKATTHGPIDFNFPEVGGEQLKLSEIKKGVTLINVMGTWCPNCRDEIQFLKELTQNPAFSDVNIVSIAFERYKEASKSMAVLKKYKKTLGISWPMVLGGKADKTKNAEQLGFVDKLYSYPTLIILDADRKIRKIHTGFYGPATSKHEAYKNELINFLTELTSE